MKVFGTLDRAQLELLTANPADLLAGRVWYDTLTSKPMLSDGSVARAILMNNDKLVIGNHATAASNIRLHRGGTATLQALLGNDTTTEGTMSANLAQVSSRIENYTDATKPAAGNAGRLIYLTDLKAYRFDNGTTWEEVGSGGAGRFNYLTQANRSSVWVKYANTTPGDRPDNFGGSTTNNISLSDETTTPLRSGLSLKFSKANTVNCQGQGYYFESTLETIDKAAMLDWLYSFMSATGYATGDLGLFAVFSTDNFASNFDVKSFSPSEISAGTYNNTLPQKQLQTPYSTSAIKVRFCIHVMSTSTVNYDVLFDDFNCGPTQYAISANIFNPEFYSMIITGVTSNPTLGTTALNRASSTRLGKYALIHYELKTTSAGTAGTGTYLFSLPPGLQIDTNYQNISTASLSDNECGEAIVYTVDATKPATGVVRAYDATHLSLVVGMDTNQPAEMASTYYSLSSSAVQISFTALVPILGWESSARSSDQYDGRVIDTRVYLSSAQSIPNATQTKVEYNATTSDKALLWDSTNKRFVAKEDATYEYGGIFQFYRSTGGTVRSARIVKNGGGTPEIVGFASFPPEASTPTDYARPIPTGTVDLKYGETLEVQVYQDSGGALNLVANGAAFDHFWVKKVCGASAISARAKFQVNARRITSDQALGTNAELIFNTADINDGGIYSVSNGRCTANKDCRVKATYSVIMQTGTGSANVQAYFLKNGAGTLYAYAIRNGVTNGTSYHLSGTAIIELQKGQYVSAWGAIDTVAGGMKTNSTVTFELE